MKAIVSFPIKRLMESLSETNESVYRHFSPVTTTEELSFSRLLILVIYLYLFIPIHKYTNSREIITKTEINIGINQKLVFFSELKYKK